MSTILFCFLHTLCGRQTLSPTGLILPLLLLTLIPTPALFAQTAPAPPSPPTSPLSPAPQTTGIPSHPFPQHTRYAVGSILPSQLPRQQMDDSVRAFYTGWKQRYIRNIPATGNPAAQIPSASETQSYVWTEGAPGNEQSLSEGQGYGMIIVALMAGYDQTAKSTYDGLFRYCRAHPSRNNPFLMAWAQDKHLKDQDGSSATDGDMDIAASLLLADAQWGSAGEIDYRKEAMQTMNAILRQEINPRTFSVLLSNDVEHDSKDYFDMRSSDFMPDHFRAFEKASREPSAAALSSLNPRSADSLPAYSLPADPHQTGPAPTTFHPSDPPHATPHPTSPALAATLWHKVLDNNYKLFAFLQDRYSPEAGLFPDFIQHITDPENPQPPPENQSPLPNILSHPETSLSPENPSYPAGAPQNHPAPQKAVPAHPHYLESRFDGMYNYNACRTPWRIATDYLLNGDPRAKKILEKINHWIKQTSRNDPDNISAGYTLAGEDLRTRHFEALSFIAPFATAAMVDPSHQEWLNKLWDYLMGFRLTGFDYYDNSIKMIDLILLSGNYWNP